VRENEEMVGEEARWSLKESEEKAVFSVNRQLKVDKDGAVMQIETICEKKGYT